jgi:tetratricopeptide (TPR) repeat protein
MGMNAHYAGTTFTLAELELHAGDWEAAERAVRPGYDSFVAMGESSFLGGAATYLARAVYEKGGYDEAQELVDVVRAVGDPQAEVDWRAVGAKLLAQRGDFAEASSLAREAVDRCERGDSPVRQARMLEDLAEVLRLAGRSDEAGAALADALERHERKENALGASRVRARLARVRETPGPTRTA